MSMISKVEFNIQSAWLVYREKVPTNPTRVIQNSQKNSKGSHWKRWASHNTNARRLVIERAVSVDSYWGTDEPNISSIGRALPQTSLCSWTNDTYMIYFIHRRLRFDSRRLHPARRYLAMLSEKLFRRTNLWPTDSCVLFQNEHKFPQTSFSSGSDQYGSDKPGHLPGAAGHEEGLWHIMIWALIAWHV